MYDSIITVFNFHEKTETWRTTVFEGVSLYEVSAETATRDSGKTNSDTVDLIIPTQADVICRYTGSKAYANMDDPQGFFTFKAESDFFVVGNHFSLEPISDDDYDEGLYHHLNNTQDGVYMITSVAFFGLLPHFEIGGR